MGESLEEINESNSQNDIDKFKLWIDVQLSYQTEEDEDVEVGLIKLKNLINKHILIYNMMSIYKKLPTNLQMNIMEYLINKHKIGKLFWNNFPILFINYYLLTVL